MAIFSRKKSKAKKEEEEAKIAAAKAALAAKKPQRGRNGKIIAPVEAPSSDLVHDIPAPSQLPRDFHSPQIRQKALNRERGYSFEEGNHIEDGKHDYFDPHSSSDSGYATPGPDYQGQSRPLSPTDYLPVPAKSASGLTLGEEIAQEPAFSDQSDEASDRQQPIANKSLKSSRSLQTLRQHAGPSHHSPCNMPPHQQYQHQDGRQQRSIQQNMPMRPSSVPAQALRPRVERIQSLSAQRGRSLATVDDVESNLAHNGSTPPLSILNGLKVNKRGLILNEEGDPVGELVEGDILDCVRERANACGDVLDEYGRVVGKVRTLPMRPAASNLRRSMTSASAWEQRRDMSSLPPLPAMRPADESSQSDEDQRVEYAQSEGRMSMTPHDSGNLDIHQSQADERATPQEASIQNSSAVGSSIHRSESLPSVPETNSTADIVLSDNDSTASTSVQQVALETEPKSNQVSASQTNAEKAQQSQVVIETDEVLPSSVPGSSKSVAFAAPAQENFGLPTTMPAFSRSVSEQALWNANAPPVPQVPKSFLEQKINGQPVGLFTPSTRAKAAPLPAFPGRGLSVGLAGSGFNGPMPGVQNRRLTMPAYASQSMSQPPLGKPRNSVPLVRSPLSSHETTPPGSAPASPKGYFKLTYAQSQGHSRSQSLKTVNTTASAPGGAKPRKVFAHAGQAAADKNADIVVKEVADDKKADKKKKGVKGFFGKKK